MNRCHERLKNQKTWLLNLSKKALVFRRFYAMAYGFYEESGYCFGLLYKIADNKI